jgi:hypothetical protein
LGAGSSWRAAWHLKRTLVFPNGSALDRRWPQFLETEQHGKGPFQLPVEIHLLASQALQLVGIEGLTERLFAEFHGQIAMMSRD